MKKILLTSLKRGAKAVLATAALLTFAAPISAQEKYQSDDLYFVIDKQANTAELVASDEPGTYVSGTLQIPGHIDYNGQNIAVTSVGDYAFSFNTELTTVVVPTTVTRIGKGAFQGCTALSGITFQLTKVEEIDDAAFEGCTALGSIYIPRTLKRLGSWAFHGCTALRNVSLPATLTEVGKNVFMNCTNLTGASLLFPMETFPEGMFDHCKNLITVNIASSVRNKIKNIGLAAFYDCPKLSNFTLGTSTERLEPCSFMSCTSLRKMNIPETVDYIGHDAFSACQSMASVNIPDAVDTIGDHAFKDAHSLRSISMSDNVKYLGEQAFAYCRNMSKANLSSQVSTVPFKAFAGCTRLTDFVLPETVTVIEDSAFQGTKCFTDLKLSSAVTSVGKYAFADNANLVSYEWPEGINALPEGVFRGCKKIDTVDIARTINTIGDYAFADCDTIYYAHIPKEVSDPGNYVFYHDILKQLWVEWDEGPDINSNYFGRCDTLYVPKGKLIRYWKKPGWKDAKRKRAYDMSLVGIEDVTIKDDSNAPYYTIEGIRVFAPKKGEIYIHDGKKIVF